MAEKEGADLPPGLGGCLMKWSELPEVHCIGIGTFLGGGGGGEL